MLGAVDHSFFDQRVARGAELALGACGDVGDLLRTVRSRSEFGHRPQIKPLPRTAAPVTDAKEAVVELGERDRLDGVHDVDVDRRRARGVPYVVGEELYEERIAAAHGDDARNRAGGVRDALPL